MPSPADAASARSADRPDLVTVLRRVADVDGWLTRGQAAALFASAMRCPPGGTIVEIGSFQGRSTIVLASAAADDVDVIAIDPHAGNDRGPQEIDGFAADAEADHRAFLANLEASGVADRVRHLRQFSDDALDDVAGPVDLLYIDGAHRYGPARADIKDWGNRVAVGGTMLIHDSFSSVGVTAAILRELLPSSRFRYVRRSRSMTVYRRRDDMSLKTRMVSAGRQLLQLPWFAKNLLLKVLLTMRIGKLYRLVGRDEPEWPY